MTTHRNKQYTYFAAGIITLLGLVFLSRFNGCNGNLKPKFSTVYDSTQVSSITKAGDTSSIAIKAKGIDTMYIPSIAYVPKHFYHDTTMYDTVVLIPDTAAIIKEWLSTARYYVQAIRDSDLFIQIEDTVYQNEIVWRKVDRRILRPTTIVQIQPKPRVKIHAGGQLALSRGQWGLIPELMVTDRKFRAFSIGYNINQPTVYVGAYFPLSIKP